MAGEEDDDGVFGLRGLEAFERLREARFQRGRAARPGEAAERVEDVGLRRVAVEERDDLRPTEATEARLLAFDFGAELARVGHGVLEVELRVRVLVDADGEHVERARALQALGARQRERRVLALHVVAVEGVGDQTVLARDDGDARFEHDRRAGP